MQKGRAEVEAEQNEVNFSSLSRIAGELSMIRTSADEVR